ncbi:MAG: hypothetical protein IPP74_01375 [Alphaproteobacteria bacterium]|nr:hypothetical protein [Alphaproteobacteria bacterium]
MREQMLENSEVNWSNTPVDEEELRELCVQLKAPECSIKAIILDNSASPIGGAEQNGMEYRLLFKALQVNRSVTYLSLIGNHMTSEAITTCLVPMLKANSTLQQLNLQDNKLYGSDLLAVTEALRTNPQSALSVLILTANPVGKIQGFNLKISEATFNGITKTLRQIAPSKR